MALLDLRGRRDHFLNSWVTRVFRFPFRFLGVSWFTWLSGCLSCVSGAGNSSALTISLDPWRNSSFHLSHPYALGTLLFCCQILLGYNWLSSFGSFPVTAWLVSSSELLLLSPRIVPLCRVLATVMGVRVWKICFPPLRKVCESRASITEGPFQGSLLLLSPRWRGRWRALQGKDCSFLRSPVFLMYLRVSSRELGDSLWSQPLTDGDRGENGRLGGN